MDHRFHVVFLHEIGPKLLLGVALLSGLSCSGGDSIEPPITGSLQITVSTSGPSPDPDGYGFSIDGGEPRLMGATSTSEVDNLTAVEHSVGLSGVAGNCLIEGENPRTITVVAGEMVTVGFAISCVTPPATTGTLTIGTTTTGTSPDPDGYIVSLDGGNTQSIGSNASLTVPFLAAGEHRVTLSGVAGNCAVQGDNPRSATTISGANTDLSFAIVCTATTGAIRVSVTTSGSSPDPDGYTVALDGGAPVAIAGDGTHTFDGISVGEHRIELSGIAANCRAEGGHIRTLSVTAGSTITATYAVTCASTGVTKWFSIPLGNAFEWLDLWGSSPTDLFVVGADRDASVSVIWHYDGQRWSEQFRRAGITLYGIWGSSISDVFAVASRTGIAAGTILHYDGARWLDMPGPVFGGDGEHIPSYGAVWGTSPSNVFAGGVLFRSGPYKALLAHYDGMAWTEMNGNVGGEDAGISEISGSSTTNVYAIGSGQLCDGCKGSPSFLARYNGSGWVESFGTRNYGFQGVWVGGTNDVWIAGSGYEIGHGVVLHYDGTNHSESFGGTLSGELEPSLSDIWGTSNSDIYAVGAGGILHYDGRIWTEINPTAGTQVWGSSANDVFVLTANSILHGTP